MPTHCENIIHDQNYPLCLRYFILVHRLPAGESMLMIEYNGEPECYATYDNKRVRLTYASRGGKLLFEYGDENGSVWVDELSEFSVKE